jgi:putative tricarboxylic transport membrane protein
VSEGDVAVLWSSPFTIGLYLVLAAALVISGVQHLRHRRKAKLEAQTVAVRIPEPLDADR